MNSIRKEAFKRFNENKMAAIAVSIFCILVTCAGVLLSFYLSSILYLLFFFLLALPVFFMGHASFISMLLGQPLTFKNAFLYYRRYYSFTFFGCYKIIKSCLKALLVIVSLGIIAGTLYFAIGSRFNPNILEDFNNTLTAITNSDYNETLTMNDLYMMNGGVLGKYVLYCVYPITIVGAMYLAFSLSTNSLNIYVRMSFPMWSRSVISMVERQFYSQNRWKLKKELIALNWPMYLTMLIFGAAGIVLSYKFEFPGGLENVGNFGILFMVASSIFFLPTYFFKMQGLFEKHEEEYKKCALVVGNDLLARLKASRMMDEEQEKDADQLLEDLKKSLDEEKAKSDENLGE